MAQKKWHKSTERLPENPQEYLLISYITEGLCGRKIRIVTTLSYFTPEIYIKDGIFYYAGVVVDYWSELNALPKDAPLRYAEKMPALNPQLCD